MASFSVLFWNIWLDNQIKGPHNATPLFNEINRIYKIYQPDYMGLNEVLQNTKSDKPFINQYLNDIGYKNVYYAPASPINESWVMGNLAATKLDVISQKHICLGPDKFAEKRGYKDHTLKAVSLNIKLKQNINVTIIVVHPVVLRPYTLKSHYEQTNLLDQHIRNHKNINNLIIGGDINEPKNMPNSFVHITKDYLSHKTGNYKKSTWSLNGKEVKPLSANLDKIFWATNGKIQLNKFEVIDSKISDHKPIYAEFMVDEST